MVRHISMVAERVREYGSVQLGDGGGRLFAVAGSGRVWRSAAASWLDDFEVAAESVQDFSNSCRRVAGRA